MTQGILPFKYEDEKSESGQTAHAGLFVYLDLLEACGLRKSVGERLWVRGGDQGWTDYQVVLSLIMLNLAGGDCVDDLDLLEGDDGFCRLYRMAESSGLSRRERRALASRFRKGRSRSLPSPSSVFRFLSEFCSGDHLSSLSLVNSDLLGFVQRNNPERVATLDMDATLVQSSKSDAAYCYKGFKSYQPLNVYWHEQGLVVNSEFREGNVTAMTGLLDMFKRSLELLPDGVESVRLRSDSAGYQHDLMRYCELGKNERFGRIEFAISCSVTSEFKRAVLEVEESDWHTIYRKKGDGLVDTGRQWAEVCFVPNGVSRSKRGRYRYLATRERLRQQPLPGMEDQLNLPFPTLTIASDIYKIFGVVTNLDWDAQEVIIWLNGRCGKSEGAHSEMKSDFAGGKLPSGNFAANAAWWQIMILSLNINTAMKRLALGEQWTNKRMKAIRFSIINIPGRIISHSRQLIVRLCRGHPCLQLLLNARQRIYQLMPEPSR